MRDGQFAAPAGRYHVVRYDQRGFGRSGYPREPFPAVADLGAVLGRAGAERAVLAGASAGGATVIDCTLTRPGRVAVLVAAAAGVFGIRTATPPPGLPLPGSRTRRIGSSGPAGSQASEHRRPVRPALPQARRTMIT
jgi:pimeloyl-ACP methyl ester carboxylesterase